jgi:hypothetical protein
LSFDVEFCEPGGKILPISRRSGHSRARGELANSWQPHLITVQSCQGWFYTSSKGGFIPWPKGLIVGVAVHLPGGALANQAWRGILLRDDHVPAAWFRPVWLHRQSGGVPPLIGPSAYTDHRAVIVACQMCPFFNPQPGLRLAIAHSMSNRDGQLSPITCRGRSLADSWLTVWAI